MWSSNHAASKTLAQDFHNVVLPITSQISLSGFPRQSVDCRRGRRRSCEEVLNALATFHRLRYAYERWRTHLTARTFAQWSVSRVLATCPVAMCPLAPPSVHWGFVVLQARAPATTSTTSRICYCRGKPIGSAHRQCLFGSVATLSQGSTSRAHRFTSAEGAGGVTWRRWQLLLPRYRVVETALSREKKNEEISDGDKESALVNIVVTHMFCGDQSVVFQAVSQAVFSMTTDPA